MRWYLRFKLSFRDPAEMMAERGIDLGAYDYTGMHPNTTFMNLKVSARSVTYAAWVDAETNDQGINFSSPLCGWPSSMACNVLAI